MLMYDDSSWQYGREGIAAALDGAAVNAMLVEGAMPDLVRFAKETLA